MNTLAWALPAAALAVVFVRRRSVAIAITALQSLLLGIQALSIGAGSTALLVAGVALIVKAIVLPALLVSVLRRTREPQGIATATHPLVRVAAAALLATLAAWLVPRLALHPPGIGRAAVALLMLGVAVAIVRRPVIFQVLGFLIAENGIYLAALTARHGIPAFIDLGLLFDLTVVVSVAGAFGTRIHARLGTSDTTLLRGLRD